MEMKGGFLIYFNPRAPCGARRTETVHKSGYTSISTHAPLAGRDIMDWFGDTFFIISTHAPLAGRDNWGYELICHPMVISTHAPLAGRDRKPLCMVQQQKNFNPRAPCGARRRRQVQ